MDATTLEKNIWETSSARFNAAERLARQSMLSLYAGAALSLAAAMLSASTMLRPSNAMTLASMLASAAALAFSLVEASAGHGIKSERLHTCALRLRALLRELPDVPLADAVRRYSEIVAECPDNHATMDWNLALAPRGRDGRWARWRYALLAYGWRFGLILLGGAAAALPVVMAWKGP